MEQPGQLELFHGQPEARCPERWAEELSLRLKRPVKLSFGRARRNVIVAKHNGQELHVRLNEHFALAPPEIGEALAGWLQHGARDKHASRVLDRWVEELGQRLGPPKRRAATLRTAGKQHELSSMAKSILAKHFPNELQKVPGTDAAWHERVTWGRRGSRRARRSIQLGSYDPELQLIRIHPVLDQSFIPAFFVHYVLFHELLHAALDKGPKQIERERPHPPAFQRRERAYPDFEKAAQWQKSNLRRLLRSARALAQGSS